MAKEPINNDILFNKQPDIFIFDPSEIGTAEDIAMLQALYSRSTKSIIDNIITLKKSRGNIIQRFIHTAARWLLKVCSHTGNSFMAKFYVGYGHKSIGDCGGTIIFFEGVSILAAKAIEDNAMYSGTEGSTRYIDYSVQPMIDPTKAFDTMLLLSRWMDFYNASLKPLQKHLSIQFPLTADQNPDIWEKAIVVRSFDILRAFIPPAMTTKLSWATNLRQAQDNLTRLKFHPLEEVQQLACRTLTLLRAKYPDSFSHREDVDANIYYERVAFDANYSDYTGYNHKEDYITWASTINTAKLYLGNNQVVLDTRPKNALLPRYLAKYGTYTCDFLLDYGSYRDVQRHRNGICRLPLLTTDIGFNSWYLDQLPEVLWTEAMDLINNQLSVMQTLQQQYTISRETMQYYIPMGFNVDVELVYDITQMVYVTELRSGAMVHPTLRKIAHCMDAILTSQYPTMRLYTDRSIDVWDIRRGMQDIVKRVD